MEGHSDRGRLAGNPLPTRTSKICERPFRAVETPQSPVRLSHIAGETAALPDSRETPGYRRVRDLTPVTNGSLGTLSIRRRFTNNTGSTVNRLRFRVVNITTLGTPISMPPQAELRLLTSGDFAVSTSLGALMVRGTLVEQPPAQPLGGGLNSSASVTLPGGGVAPGASIDVQFLLGVQTTGTFRFFVNVEGLTNPATSASGKSGRRLFTSGNQKPPGDN